MSSATVCPAEQEIDWTNCPTCGGTTQEGMWAVISISTVVACVITIYNFWRHINSYRVPLVQKQILRIILLPFVYAIISLLAFKWFKQYEYFELIESTWDALAIASFILLLYRLVVLAVTDHPFGQEQHFFDRLNQKVQDEAKACKEKGEEPYKGVMYPIPVSWWFKLWCMTCHFWRSYYQPSERFVKFILIAVLQIVPIRILLSVAGILGEADGWLCPQVYSVHFAGLWIAAINFISVTIAIYALLVFHTLCHAELEGRRVLHKFLAIKLVIMVLFYQTFMIDILEHGDIISSTQYYTKSDAGKLWTSVLTALEMAIFSAYMLWAYGANEFIGPKSDDIDHVDEKHLQEDGTYVKYKVSQALWDTINIIDYFTELWAAFGFLSGYISWRWRHGGRSRTMLSQMKNKYSFLTVEMATMVTKYHGRKRRDNESRGGESEKATS
ncbi:hypothetical protein TREMEDRAFT_58246 [Tremella mesenterica DSM 1558]|uniref:uncharacterized protein n=1 Tax=Tremella mesenterica (strain ATCC 24925 / CBS 8224 / DSM 1558 / NBRC 9311 / NRRL Y-6157 / RJB 2259-6 / UBC 559-6) TaxID=578456 RepID=UPI0003F49FD9|nr:uncharacterized protein TREMEDRAFT_58246 [Tremella mesenterica DSM 1558]EIW72093.1 hypothetical protein TREMEDRAFT_58246 [Tremella mesenterica DSM 1558]